MVFRGSLKNEEMKNAAFYIEGGVFHLRGILEFVD